MAIYTAAVAGAEAHLVKVEVSISAGIPGLDIIGMPDSAVLEARARVRCALKAAGFDVPRLHITVNLAPGAIRKIGTAFDLPIALAILSETNQIPFEGLEQGLYIGELGLDGSIHAVRGEIACGLLAASRQLTLVTRVTSWTLCELDTQVRSVRSLRDFMKGFKRLESPERSECTEESETTTLDYAEVRGQEMAKRALVISAVGSHPLLMIGPPGTGKSMLAERFHTILPPLELSELRESLAIHSICGKNLTDLSLRQRPFRAPHHSISIAGLIGGGRPIMPGEISLAHNGVLFLDELAEFSSHTLQSLRQPLESHTVVVVRAEGMYRFPANFLLLAAANPCPCGYFGDKEHQCTCSEHRIMQYQNKLGGPLLDRIDLSVEVLRPRFDQLVEGGAARSSQDMREDVQRGYEFRGWRMKHAVQSHIPWIDFDAQARDLLKKSVEAGAMSARGITRYARVARTIADIDMSEMITQVHLSEALALRPRMQRL